MSPSVVAAIAAWKATPETEVIDTPEGLAAYTASVCASSRDVWCVLRPANANGVREIVRIANEFKTPLYPISRGGQWGMGSKLPVRDGAAIVDLSRMNRILEINEAFHYAVVEPGVTQGQLIDHIEQKGLKLMLNVTGSTSTTSLIGNAMDRGVGYFASRADGISNMTVVLGNGKTIQTGFGHVEGAKTANLFPHGIGPSLDGLFPQGNFGIVTSACIDLMPEPEHRMTAVVRVESEEKLAAVIDGMIQLRRNGIFHTIAHVGNRERSYILLAPMLYQVMLAAGGTAGPALREQAVAMLEQAGFGPWSAGVGILGTRHQLRYARREIRRTFRGIAKTTFLDDAFIRTAKRVAGILSFIPYVRKQRMLLQAIEPTYGFTQGTTTDTCINTVYWPTGDFEHLDSLDPDQSHSGLMFCLPILPASGHAVCTMVADIRGTFARHGFEAAITVNLMTSKAMEGVVSLAFDRRDVARTEAARACIQEMESRFMEQGYPPYRVGINSMHHVVKEDDPFWQTIRDLKQTLDPNHIIAPGRYNLV
ncbi:MAG: FAD-binding protein [Lentisphaerae bacterium]|nr:FAD-binding protein [Lentisphaerota bacterium]